MRGPPESSRDALQVALWHNERDNVVKQVSVSWGDLAADLCATELTDCAAYVDPRTGAKGCPGRACVEKFREAWSPTRYRADAAVRGNGGVEALTLVVFDLDDVTDTDALSRTIELLQGYRHLVHPTHQPGRYRLVIPLAHEVPVALWPAAWGAAREKFAVHFPGVEDCGDPARVYFLPSRPRGHMEHGTWSDGALWDALPALQARQIERVRPPPRPAPTSAAGPPADLTPELVARIDERMRQALRAGGQGPGGVDITLIAGRVLAREPFAVTGKRDASVTWVAKALAHLDGLSLEAAESYIGAMLDALPEDDGQGGAFWRQKFRDSFARGEVHKAQVDAVKARNAAVISGARKALGLPVGTSSEVTARTQEAAERGGLPVIATKDGARLRATTASLMRLLETEPAFKHLVFDTLAKSVRVHPAADEGAHFAGLHEDSLVTAIQYHLSAELDVNFTPEAIRSALALVTEARPYNPVGAYLESLRPGGPKEWDGINRLNRFWVRYFEATGPAEYLEVTGQKFLVSMVARGLRPGCQVDTVPILQGEGGSGKTSAARVLGGDWYCETKLSVTDKDTRMLASKYWLIELGELATLRSASVEALNSFVTNTIDSFRPPYGRAVREFPRTCVFIGTTEDPEHLPAAFSWRRWWSVANGRVHLDELARDRDQLFAEAVAAFYRGASWHFEAKDAQASAQARAVAEAAAEADPAAIQVLDWLLRLAPENRKPHYSVLEVAQGALGRVDVPHAELVRFGHVLRRTLRWVREDRFRLGLRIRKYAVPEEMLRTRRMTDKSEIAAFAARAATDNPSLMVRLLRPADGEQGAFTDDEGVEP